MRHEDLRPYYFQYDSEALELDDSVLIDRIAALVTFARWQSFVLTWACTVLGAVVTILAIYRLWP
jgi:hypothetical protein